MFRKIAANELAKLLSILSNQDRIRIIEELNANELDVSELQNRLQINQSTLSRHLGLLRTSKIVAERKEGRRVYYHLSMPSIATWLIEGIGIICEREKSEIPITKVFKSAKKLWQVAQ